MNIDFIKILGIPDKCEKCGRVRNVQWISKSMAFLEDKSDYVALCKLCRENFRKVNTDFTPEIESTKSKIEKSKSDLRELENRIGVRNSELDVLVKEIDSCNSKIKRSEREFKLLIKNTEDKLNDISRNVEIKNSELKSLNKNIPIKNQEIESLNNNIVDLEIKSKELFNKNLELEIEIELKKDQLAEMEQNKKDAERIISKKNTIMDEIEKEKNALTERERKCGIRERSLIRLYEQKMGTYLKEI